MSERFRRVGEVAERCGISVRALHHYHEIGLLVPSHGGDGSGRLYSPRDLARLERILALRSLGLPLAAIRTALDRPGSARELLERRLAELRERVAQERRLLRRLERIAERLGGREEATLDDLKESLEALTMFERYYTPEQLQELDARAAVLGPDTLQAVQEEWPRLIAAVRAAHARGADPTDPEVQALVRRWGELVALFTGGDAGIARSLGRLLQGEPAVAERTGVDPELLDHVSRARAALPPMED